MKKPLQDHYLNNYFRPAKTASTQSAIIKNYQSYLQKQQTKRAEHPKAKPLLRQHRPATHSFDSEVEGKRMQSKGVVTFP